MTLNHSLKIVNCKLKTISFLVYTFFMLPASVFAASLYFDPADINVSVGDEVLLTIGFRSEGETINALEGIFSFASEQWEVQEVRDGDSFIHFWITKPEVSPGGIIRFSGIVPGGFPLETGTVFSLVVKARESGTGTFDVREAWAVIHDGLGTKTVLQPHTVFYAISQRRAGDKEEKIISVADTAPPEEFAPVVVRDATTFDGKWFLVFSTRDTGSGVSRFEVYEHTSKHIPSDAKWQVVNNPYVLVDQQRKRYVFIRAVDRAGNIREVVVAPLYTWYKNKLLWIGIISTLVVCLFICVRKYKQRV